MWGISSRFRASSALRNGVAGALLAATTAVAQLALAVRRPPIGSTDVPRQLEFIRQSGFDSALLLGPTRTTDVPVGSGTWGLSPDLAVRLNYAGDTSSILFMWDNLTGNWGAVSQFAGPPLSVGTHPLVPSSLGLFNGALYARNYDRGMCSAFSEWRPFFDQLRTQLDARILAGASASGAGAATSGRAQFIPIVRVDKSWKIYSGDTRDLFRMTRSYDLWWGAARWTWIVSVQGGLRTQPDGSVHFVGEAQVVNPANPADSGASDLRDRINRELPPAIDAAIADNFFHFVDAAFWSCGSSSQSQEEQDQLCVSRFRMLFSGIEGLEIGPTQARCRPRDNAGMRCQIRPNVSRTQEYPSGIEFVLSDKEGDASWKLLEQSGPATMDALCGDARAPWNRTLVGPVTTMTGNMAPLLE